ncbi:hypothetical protein Q4Q40_09450 [Flavivirga jejuensis]|uniref:Cytochrome c domain-containing protein n=2 Tax=Flavivirga jejuensis TaxID=870487 RepID=A0ABT8WMQ3_9FLAO|nr:hypothetical protein [Flavivirga jejuensis]
MIFSIFSCHNDDSDDNNSESEKSNLKSFLSEIRPVYFNNLNFESSEVENAMPVFFNNLRLTYNDLEKQFNEGKFTTNFDLNQMRRAQMYYSFYITGVVGAYLEGTIDFKSITGDVKQGIYSGVNVDNPDFIQKEIKALMDRATEVAEKAVNIAGYNDLTYGFYAIIKQVQQRASNNNINNAENHDLIIDYTQQVLKDYTLVPVWNLLAPQVAMSNYKDPLNTFDNPNLNLLLKQINERLGPDAVPSLGGQTTEIIGPLYRMDLNIKKIDWLFKSNPILSQDQINELKEYLDVTDVAANSIEVSRASVLEVWKDNKTYYERKDKISAIKEYWEAARQGKKAERPELESFIDSKNFKKAYQCFACHQLTNQ